MRKLITIILCSVTLFAALSGCRNIDADVLNEADYLFAGVDAQQNGLDSSSMGVLETRLIDYDAAFAAFAPETVMMNIGGYNVTWGEYFFYLRGNINLLESSYLGFSNWTEIIYDDMTLSDIILLYSTDNAHMYKAFEYGSMISGVSLSEEDKVFLLEEYEQMAMFYGGEDVFLRYMWEEDGCYSREQLEYFMGVGQLANLVFSELYGEVGEKVSDEECAEFTQYEELLMAKHILLREPEDSEGVALNTAEELLWLLITYNGDDFDAYFDELMLEYSADQGAFAQYPHGYLFQ